jgi:cobalamin biosynthesis Co2+ chelatase CbiK
VLVVAYHINPGNEYNSIALTAQNQAAKFDPINVDSPKCLSNVIPMFHGFAITPNPYKHSLSAMFEAYVKNVSYQKE